ncbi:Histone deacetylase complex subunit [Fusarium equiseti]|uniref:Histone deacetylase complex subunit n=1 Tax=Fusarium equiseti TaxID=61235 RepID=A0ABQ8RQ45_FUSEQ|nr:Histone deacetylase complex subunit [Fusarium equiseti]
MAPPSPRRSSRARATNSQSQQSSVSSNTSGRVERNTRSVAKPSSNKSTPSGSLSSEPFEDLDDTLLGRRRKRNQEDENDKNSKSDNFDMANGSDDLQEEEDEAVRCICDAEEYPGRPPVEGADLDFFNAIEFTEDVTGFFVQCDICKVWQHGACVGIFSAESSPDEYFCEQCRKELHKIYTASNGQKWSKYVPHNRPSRATSRATSIAKEGNRSPKTGTSRNSRPTSASQTSKRRSTMNSRDRAYEDEQLLRAIEASKEDAPQDGSEILTRRAKRGRSDSEESVAVNSRPRDEKLASLRNTVSVKRQRTSSMSPSPPIEPAEVQGHNESDEEINTRNGVKKARNNKSQRAKTDKEDKERQRQEAADKRKGRAERRRGEDSDPSEETPPAAAKPLATKSIETPVIMETPTPAQPAPDTPPVNHQPIPSTQKRGGRTAHKKGKGRNQYTRDRDGEGESPARSMSRDIQKNGDEPTPTHPKPTSEPRPGKSKPAIHHKLNMVDMKRRVGAIMDFISRTQVDLAAETFPVTNGNTNNEKVSLQKPLTPETVGGEGAHDSPGGKEFKDLNCMEMMDILTRDMVKWQNQYT